MEQEEVSRIHSRKLANEKKNIPARNKQQTYIRPTSMFTSTHNLSYSHLRSAVSFTNVMT